MNPEKNKLTLLLIFILTIALAGCLQFGEPVESTEDYVCTIIERLRAGEDDVNNIIPEAFLGDFQSIDLESLYIDESLDYDAALSGFLENDFAYVAAKYILALAMNDFETAETLVGRSIYPEYEISFENHKSMIGLPDETVPLRVTIASKQIIYRPNEVIITDFYEEDYPDFNEFAKASVHIQFQESTLFQDDASSKDCLDDLRNQLLAEVAGLTLEEIEKIPAEIDSKRFILSIYLGKNVEGQWKVLRPLFAALED